VTVSIRPLSADDETAVVEFYRRTHQDDPTVGAISVAGWRHFAAMSHNQGGRDFRAAWAGDRARDRARGRVDGVATTSQRARAEPWIRHFRIVVEPAWRRRGIGGALLRALADLDAPHPVLLQTLCPQDWLAGAAFLETAGFAPVENEIDMECAALIAPPRPGTWEMRRLAEPQALAEPIAALHNRAYAGTPSFVELGGGEMAELLAEGELWVAECRGALVAICHLEPEGAKLRLESLAVEPAWQGRGAGPALAYRALTEAGAGAERAACLSVSDRNPPALRAYARLGFRAVFSSTRYRADRAQVLAAMS